jgi:predicted TIM-barrel fold metal-dependent hydrolase
MCAYDYYGADHMLFGTDSPLGPRWGMTENTIDSIERMDISEGEKQKIFKTNAVNLFKLAL